MPYVERDEAGNVVGIYANPQPGFAEELMEGPVSLAPPLAPPSAPTIAAAAFGLTVADGDISGLDGGFNIGGAIYFGPGEYLVFFIQPIEGRYAPVFMAGGSVAMSATAADAYSMTIEARSDGVPADPDGFSLQVFKL